MLEASGFGVLLFYLRRVDGFNFRRDVSEMNSNFWSSGKKTRLDLIGWMRKASVHDDNG